MKPKIGQTVYLAAYSINEAYKKTVGYLGKHSFVVECYDFCGYLWQERFYDDEGETWFATLKDLKKAYPNARYSRSEGCYVLGERK